MDSVPEKHLLSIPAVEYLKSLGRKAKWDKIKNWNS